MFKKFLDKFKPGSTEEEEKVLMLQNMGFNANQSREALRVTNGNAERAAEWLLSNNNNNNGYSSNSNEEEQLRRAMEESLLTNDSKHATAQTSQRVTVTSAASKRAGQAALSRFETSKKTPYGNINGKVSRKVTKTTTTSKSDPSSSSSKPVSFSHNKHALNDQSKKEELKKHHPTVQMPTQMSEKSKEEQIARCALRLAPHPLAVDTMLKSLLSIRSDPSSTTFRTIDRSHPGYQRALANKPGAEDMLFAVNFAPQSNSQKIYLDSSRVDTILLTMAISALEQTRLTDEYKRAKRQNTFEKQITKIIQSANSDEKEALQRSKHLSKCPSEPQEGTGALLQLYLGPSNKISRRFDGDDTLKDVLHWIGAQGSVIFDKLTSGEWSLIDLNSYPIQPIHIHPPQHMERTLQFIGCWPSGKLEIRPSEQELK